MEGFMSARGVPSRAGLMIGRTVQNRIQKAFPHNGCDAGEVIHGRTIV